MTRQFCFLKLQLAFWQFQTKTVSECSLIKLLPDVLFEKYIDIAALETETREPALCRLYRHTFVLYGPGFWGPVSLRSLSVPAQNKNKSEILSFGLVWFE